MQGCRRLHLHPCPHGFQTLHRDALKILEALKERHPARMTQVEIEGATRITRKTIGKRLNELRNMGLVERSKGERGGEGLTLLGLQLLGRPAQ